jgi:hypothetical protein
MFPGRDLRQSKGPAVASSTERIRVKLPANFDPARHMGQLMKKVTEAHGEGFEIDSIVDGEAVATRQVTITEVRQGEKSQTQEVRLPRTVKPTDGEKMAVKLADQHGDGWEMTKFEPYLGKAVLTKLTPETARCRGAAALALGVKPWEVQVAPRKDGGFDLELPRTYMPSKHYSKLEEVATGVVGNDGWYVRVNAQKLTASIIPSAPPTFPGMIPTPMDSVVKFDHTNKETFKIPLGMKLPAAGETVGETFALDMNAGAHAQLGGISGGGKTVLLNCYLATWLAKGAELAIIDLPTKSADFEWCKDFVRPGGWGCASPAQSAVAIRLIMDEGERRSAHIKAHGVNDWKLLPKNAALKPLVVIVDELTGLFALEAVPKAGKDAPQLLKDMADEANRTNLFKEILKNGIKRVAAELRFTGVFLMLATQVASANTGIDPSLRTNLHHKLLMGAKPTEGNRRLVFSDPERVPLVPENVRTDGGASRGVGSTEPEGDEPSVFKSYYATVTEYRAWLEKLGVPKTGQPEPTKAQMAQLEDAFEPAEDQDDIATRRAAMRDPMADLMGDSGLDENGRSLKGAALAASQSRQLSNMGGRA